MYILKSQPSTAPRTSSAIPQIALCSAARCDSFSASAMFDPFRSHASSAGSYAGTHRLLRIIK